MRGGCGGRGLGGKGKDQAVQVGGVRFQIAGDRDRRGLADGALGFDEVAAGCGAAAADEGLPQAVRRNAGRIDPESGAGVHQYPEGLGAVHAGVVAPAGGEQKPVGLSRADRRQVVQHGTPHCLGKGHPAAFDSPYVFPPPPPFEVLACYGDFTDDIGTVPDLADSQRKQLLDPVPRSAAQDQEQPVTRAVGGGEVLGESEVFGFGEGAGTHAHKMALP